MSEASFYFDAKFALVVSQVSLVLRPQYGYRAIGRDVGELASSTLRRETGSYSTWMFWATPFASTPPILDWGSRN